MSTVAELPVHVAPSNRIVHAFSQMQRQIQQRLAGGKTTMAKVDELSAALDLNFSDFCSFQDVKSWAHAAGLLSLSEAQTIYISLGNTPFTFNSRPIEEKVVLTQIFKELLGMKLAGLGR